MDGLQDINSYADLRETFIKLDRNYDAHISEDESAEDVEQFDLDKDGTIGLWEYMEAVNQQARKEVFAKTDIETNCQAYTLMSRIIEDIKATSPSLRWHIFSLGGIGTDHHKSDRVIVIDFLQGLLRAGLNEELILTAVTDIFYKTRRHLSDISFCLPFFILGASSEEIVRVINHEKYYSFKNNLADFANNMSAIGFTVKDILACLDSLVSINGCLPRGAPEAYNQLINLGFSRAQAIFHINNIRSSNSCYEWSQGTFDYFPAIITKLSSRQDISKEQIIEFIQKISSGYIDKNKIEILLAFIEHGWEPVNIFPAYDTVSSIYGGIHGDPANKFALPLIKIIGQSEPNNTPNLYRAITPLVSSLNEPRLIEQHFLSIFSYALQKRNIALANETLDLARNFNTADHRINLLKSIALSSDFNPVFQPTLIFEYFAIYDSLNLIGLKTKHAFPCVVPGEIAIQGKKLTVKHFNRRAFDAVFIDPGTNLDAAGPLLEVSEILPESFFYTFNKTRLQIYFRHEKNKDAAGYYNPNEVVIDTAHGCSPGTIIHELAHHWDLNLTIGFNGQQNSSGDLSLQYYAISWRQAENGFWVNKSVVQPGDFAASDHAQKNEVEDFACLVEEYVSSPASLRKKIRDEVNKGNFELAVKYLFIKHLTPFQGKEYGLVDSDRGITLEEIENAYASAADFLKTNEQIPLIINTVKRSL